VKGKRIGIAVVALGMVLIIVALVVKLAIVPSMKQWPDDVDETRYYEGALHTMLNAQALASMDLPNVFVRDVPVDVSRHYTTEETDGKKAIVKEVIVVSGPEAEILTSESWYAIDRKTTESIPDFTDNPDIPDREGLVINFPIGTKKHDYQRWVADLQATAPLTYLREEKSNGIETYVFESVVSPGEIKDPKVLAALPPAIPKNLLSVMASALNLPEAKKAALTAVLPSLPDPVPLRYTYEYKATYWIEPTTGMNIDVERSETRSAALAMGETLVPLTPVFDIEYQTTEASIAEGVDDAKEIKDALSLWGSTVPYIMIAVGAVLGIAGLMMVFRRKA